MVLQEFWYWMSRHFQAPASDKNDTEVGYRLVLLSSIFSALVKLGFPWFLGTVEKEKKFVKFREA